jgi:putative phosphoribosyl transferase
VTFEDRHDAGRRLAAELAGLELDRPVVLAIPRGGVPVAAQVCRALDAPLEILAVRKLGAPGNPELGVGAIAEGGTCVLDGESARRVGMTKELLADAVDREVRELERRVRDYRGRRPVPELEGRTVVIVDDGLATGLTDLAAVRSARGRGAARVVVAVPVGTTSAISLLEEEADAVVCLLVPEVLGGVGAWYADFEPVGEDEVQRLLTAS